MERDWSMDVTLQVDRKSKFHSLIAHNNRNNNVSYIKKYPEDRISIVLIPKK
jgi:hypothetical protein